MEGYFSIGEAAKIAGTTSETLRHYDRIGLVVPSKKDERTQYRYYTKQDIVRLNTVRALQLMDLSLQEIQKVLAYDDLPTIIAFLEQAEQKADEKIAALRYGQAKIRLAKASYQRKLEMRSVPAGITLTTLPKRTVLLSATLASPTLDTLWNYLGHFYAMLDPSQKEEFAFEDQAGIYSEGGQSHLFALCLRHGSADGLRVLPAGPYLCATCTEEDRETTLDALVREARNTYGADPQFTVELVVVSGILSWDYEIQVYVGAPAPSVP